MVTLSFSGAIMAGLEQERAKACELNNLQLYKVAQGLLWVGEGKALLEKNTAMATRPEVFDLWAQYQAKRIKGAILESETRLREVVVPGQPSSEGETTRSASMRQEIVRHQAEQEEIAREAHAKEAKQHAEVAEHLTHRHHRYAFSAALLQIAIALSAIAALGRSRPIWWLSLFTAGVGTLIFLDGFLLLV
jgi:hypothetical protein